VLGAEIPGISSGVHEPAIVGPCPERGALIGARDERIALLCAQPSASEVTYVMEAARIKEFAAEFDPQPFHLDERAARESIF
jgi:hypothetical protein